MSHAPQPVNPHPQYVQAPPQNNSTGTIGFALSMCGLFCGVMFPIGLIVSLIGLRGEPKGLAIAGSIIGGFGTLVMSAIVLMYGAMIAACIGIGISQQPVIATHSTLREADGIIEDYIDVNGEAPSLEEGDALIADKRDGWENSLRYELSDELEAGGFIVRSAGPDGQFDTLDDITSDEVRYEYDWEEEEPWDEEAMDEPESETGIPVETPEDGPVEAPPPE